MKISVYWYCLLNFDPLFSLGYKSYENVWTELKTMGDEVDSLVDKNTLGGIQFG